MLEADQLVFKRGMSVFVSTTTNFISVQNDKAVVQIAPFNAGGGPNGVGGITVEGVASNIQIKTDKRGTSYFSMSVMGKGISATVSITLPKGTDQASVTVNPNFHSNRITLNGTLMPAEKIPRIPGNHLLIPPWPKRTEGASSAHETKTAAIVRIAAVFHCGYDTAVPRRSPPPRGRNPHDGRDASYPTSSAR